MHVADPNSKYCPEVPFVIAGNKADLADYCETKEMVEWGDGLLLAAETGAVRFRTFSALTQRGLRDVFEAVAEAGLCKPTEQDKKNCCVQ
jgi:predicted GTPase